MSAVAPRTSKRDVSQAYCELVGELVARGADVVGLALDTDHLAVVRIASADRPEQLVQQLGSCPREARRALRAMTAAARLIGPAPHSGNA